MTPLFRLYLWPDRLLLLGPGFDTGFHRHHAAQLCLGLDGPLKLRHGRNESWVSAPGFFVAPDQPHQFDAGAGATAILYLEAESGACADCLRRHAQPGPSPLATTSELTPLQALRADGGQGRHLAAALRVFGIDETQQGIVVPLDPRIANALNWIGAHIDTPIRLRAVAASAALSGSHFAHLFTAQAGVPLRRYVLWRRLREAIRLAMLGASLTEAAHAAGFADSAHLSRTFRETFGVTPSFLFEQRARIAVEFCAQDPAWGSA